MQDLKKCGKVEKKIVEGLECGTLFYIGTYPIDGTNCQYQLTCEERSDKCFEGCVQPFNKDMSCIVFVSRNEEGLTGVVAEFLATNRFANYIENKIKALRKQKLQSPYKYENKKLKKEMNLIGFTEFIHKYMNNKNAAVVLLEQFLQIINTLHKY